MGAQCERRYHGPVRILVTGSEGFIGSHLADTLVRRGHDVVGFVQYTSSGSLGWLDDLDPDIRAGIRPVLGDIRDQATILPAMSGVDAVAHLAALISVPYSFEATRSFVDTNTTGTLNVIDAARAGGARRVLVMSTSEVYGSAVTRPMDESHRLHAQSPYAASKIGAEKVAESLSLSRDTDIVIARGFNTFGPRQSTRAVVGTILQQIAAGARTLTLGALGSRRDLNYVTDVARALALLLESDSGFRADVFNISTGSSVSVAEIVQCVSEIIGEAVSISVREDLLRASDVDVLEGDSRRLRASTGWTPEIDFVDGLSRTLAWWRSEERLPHPGI